MEGLWTPVYMYEGNRFFILGNPVYDTKEEAMDNVVGDGFALMCREKVSALPKETFCIPFREEDAKWLLNCQFTPDIDIVIFAGPLYEKEIINEEKD